MDKYPNQKIVTINKQPCDKNNKYALININALEKAACTLDAGAFKLWVYLSKNQNNYCFGLSNKALAETFGMKIKQYNNAVSTLIKNNYLVETSKQEYTFFEIPLIP